jgi:hypothetical protein
MEDIHMKKFIFALLIFALTACLSPSGDAAPQSVEPTSALEATATATIPPAPTATATEIPFAARPPEEQAALYLAGKVQDVSNLNSEEHAAFSAAYAEKKNEQTGINFVSFTYINDEEYFLNPKTLQPEKIPANVSDEFRQENSFKIYSRVEFDAQGNVMFQYNGEWRTVPNSAGFDFSMEITDPNHPIVVSIDIPKITEGEFSGMTPLQRNLIQKGSGGPNTFKPGVTIKDGPGEIIFKSGAAFRRVPIFPLVTFETDGTGKVVLAKISQIMPSGVFSLYEEGEGTVVTSTPTMEEYGTFWKTLEDNQIYYIAMADNPEAKIEYTSHISAENIQGINLGDTESDDVSVIAASSFVKPKID